MLLSLESLNASASADIPAVVEAEEALHWAIQGARIPYPATDAPAEVRDGPDGPTGIFRLPLAQLVGLARGHLADSFAADEWDSFTADACARYAIQPCSARTAGSDWPAIPEDPVRPELPAGDRPLAGTSITLVGCCDPATGFGDELTRFEERTGIDVAYTANPSALEAQVAAAVARGDPPDLAIFPQPGAVVDYARQGQLVDLSTYLDPGEARRQVGDYVVEATSLGSGYFGVPTELNLKGLVWYPVPEFEQAGYAIPESWDELLALSQQMVADGRNPWCIGFESGGSANGWPGTDWIEALVLRIGGVDLYEGWADGEIPFTDPVIRQAATMFGQVAFGEGFVRGGSDSISRLSDTDVGDPMFSDPPGCWLHHQASWMQVYFPPGAAAGVDLNYFPMPPIAPGGDAPLFGGGGIVGAFRDRPEVREFLRSVLSPEWGAEWAANPSGAFLSPNLGFDVGHCRSPLLDEAANAVRVRLCREAQDEIAAGLWRFDAADLMPREVGSVTEAGTPGAFYQGMLDYVDEGPESLDRILSDIEAAWPESARP